MGSIAGDPAIQTMALRCFRGAGRLKNTVIVDGAGGAELWTIYQKSMGGTKGAKTEPRQLHPLLLRDADGSAVDWMLQARCRWANNCRL